MNKIAIALLAVLVSGCAHAPLPKPQTHVAPKVIKAIPHAPPSIAQTPNQIVKKRWYDRFKTHPKWFH